MTYSFENKNLDIPSIKRQLTTIKKKEGIEVSLNKLNSFLNETLLDLDDAISIIDRYIEYANETKKDPKEIITFVMTFFEKYNSENFDNYLIPLANIYSNVRPEYGIQFISQNLNDVNDAQKKIELLFLASDNFCTLNKYNDAFKLLRQANDLCYQENLSNSISNKGKVSFKMAEIGKLEDNPDVYLSYCISGIIYESARELTNLPNIYPYFRTIEEFENNTYFLFEDDYFKSACDKILGGVAKFRDIILDILKNQLFVAFNISNSYCNEEKLKTTDIKEKIIIGNAIRELKTMDVLSAIAVINNNLNIDK